jgi:hypothetical protein
MQVWAVRMKDILSEALTYWLFFLAGQHRCRTMDELRTEYETYTFSGKADI